MVPTRWLDHFRAVGPLKFRWTTFVRLDHLSSVGPPYFVNQVVQAHESGPTARKWSKQIEGVTTCETPSHYARLGRAGRVPVWRIMAQGVPVRNLGWGRAYWSTSATSTSQWCSRPGPTSPTVPEGDLHAPAAREGQALVAAGLITGLHAPAAREELVMMGPGYRRDDPADAPGRVRPRTGGARPHGIGHDPPPRRSGRARAARVGWGG